MLKYNLFENIQQAKKFFKEHNLDTESLEIKEPFNELKKLLGNNLNYIGAFTKFHFGKENVPIYKENNDKYYDSLYGLYNYIKTQINITDYLPKNIIKYDSFENLIDDITKAQDDILINNFYKNIYTKLRKDIDIKDEKIKDIILKYIKLPEEAKKTMTPLVDYKNKGKKGMDYINDLNVFVEKLSHDRENTLKEIKKHGDNIEVVYDKNDILIIRTFDKKAIKEFGSQRWCIVYAQESYYNRYCNPLENMTQYIIFDFNKPSTDPNSLYGVSINDNGTVTYGGCQNKANVSVDFHQLIKDLNLPSDILVYKEYSLEEIKKQMDTEDIIKSGKGKKIFTDDEIQNLDISYDFKYRYMMLSSSEYNELPLYKKFDYKGYEISTDEIEELKNMSFDEKTSDKYWKMTKKYDALTNKEYNKLNLEKKDSYRNSNFSEEEKIELKKLPLETKMKYWEITKNSKLLTDKEYNNLTWKKKYTYNGGTFTESNINEINKLPFKEKMKIACKTKLIDELFTEEELKPEDYDGLNVEIYNYYIKFSSIHEPYNLMDIIGMDESEFWDFAIDDKYKDMYGEEDYIGEYLSDSILNKIKELMDILGFEYGDDITDEGVIANFMEEYKEYLVYDSIYNYGNSKLLSYNLNDLLSDVGIGIGSSYHNVVNKVNNLLPYSVDTQSLDLYDEYILELINNEENDINNVDDLLKAVETVDDIIGDYNKKIENSDGDDEYANKEKIDTSLLNKDNIIIDEYEMKQIEENFENIIKYCEENPVTKNFQKYKDILTKYGFKGDNEIKKGDVTIEIKNRDLKNGRVNIRRRINNTKDGIKVEKGWVDIDKLNDYFQKNLFENRKIIDFKTFINK